jgi:hypothetical protein
MIVQHVDEPVRRIVGVVAVIAGELLSRSQLPQAPYGQHLGNGGGEKLVDGERKCGPREMYDCWKLKSPAKHSLDNIYIKGTV